MTSIGEMIWVSFILILTILMCISAILTEDILTKLFGFFVALLICCFANQKFRYYYLKLLYPKSLIGKNLIDDEEYLQ